MQALPVGGEFLFCHMTAAAQLLFQLIQGPNNSVLRLHPGEGAQAGFGALIGFFSRGSAKQCSEEGWLCPNMAWTRQGSPIV